MELEYNLTSFHIIRSRRDTDCITKFRLTFLNSIVAEIVYGIRKVTHCFKETKSTRATWNKVTDCNIGKITRLLVTFMKYHAELSIKIWIAHGNNELE